MYNKFSPPFIFVFSDLTLHKGEIITLLKQVDENWYEGFCNDCQGFLPANYVEVILTLIKNFRTVHVNRNHWESLHAETSALNFLEPA